MKKRMLTTLAALAALAAAAAEIDPITTRWTLGAHEPFSMYRRMGKKSTGGIEGSALWLRPWMDWWDANAPARMEEFGLNALHSRFYKGMGWEVEKKDFPNVKRFVANCHAHGVTALAYVQFATLYYEPLKGEIPDIETWAAVDAQGEPYTYNGYCCRWLPCINNEKWVAYVERMCEIALREGGFDGIMFDNCFAFPCYCPRCERMFADYVRALPGREERFGYDCMALVRQPRRRLAETAADAADGAARDALGQMPRPRRDVKDPLEQEWLLWRARNLNGVLARLRRKIKQVKPDAIVSANPHPFCGAMGNARRNSIEMVSLADQLDLLIMQSDNFPAVLANGVIRSRVRDLKLAAAVGKRNVALCDGDSGRLDLDESAYLRPLVEDLVLGGIPTDRTVMNPARTPTFVDEARFAGRKRLMDAFNAYARANRALLAAPAYQPVRLFYDGETAMFSAAARDGVTAAEEICIRCHIPFGYALARGAAAPEIPADCEVLVVADQRWLSDAQVAAIAAWAKKGGRLVVTGDSGLWDERGRQRFENPLAKAVAGLANVAWRREADAVANSMGWRYTVERPADGGAALRADLAKVGWKSPVAFEDLPETVFAEVKRTAGGYAVHLVNYDPKAPVSRARLAAPGKAVFREPFGADPAAKALGPDGRLPDFVQYAVVEVAAGGDAPVLEPGAMEVVVAPRAARPVTFAAEELTNFLARAFGAPVPVVSAPTSGKVSIVLGENEWSRAAGVDVASAPRDTFAIKTAGRRVFIAGRDEDKTPLKALTGGERATLHGVYAFLEDYVGCRFYFPGELGEVVPRLERLALPEIDRRTTPDFLIRRYYNSERDGRWFDPAVDEQRAKALNWLRVRASTLNIPCCHGMNKIDLVAKYAKTHPEYFALRKDGTRCTNFTGYHSSLKGYPCLSNQGLRDVVVDWCVAEAAKGAKYVDIMPNDALQPCHCADCQAAYAKAGEDCPMSELVWGYTKYVADKLREKGVDVIVTQMAYAQYRRIPKGVDIPDNVRVMVAESGPWALSNSAALGRQYDEIRAWKAKSGNPIWIWTYPHKYWSLAVPGLADVAPKAWGAYFKPLKGEILGTFAESETDRWLYHYLNYYVFARVMWDASTDVEALLDEHHHLMFGAGAAPMKAFYEELERKWTRELAGKVEDSALGPVTVPPTEPEIWERIYSPAETARLGALLDKAAAAVAPGSLEARRVALVRREYFEPIVAAGADYLRRRDAIRALVYAAGRDKPIALRPFGVRKGREPEEYVKTEVTIRRADDALVVRYDAEESRMDDMQGSKRAFDDPETWRDAGLEIYLNPSADLTTYYHIIVNLHGSVSDSKGVRTGARSQIVDSSWNSGATVRIDARAGGWTAEVRIPLAALGEVKEAFPAEFVRNRNTRSGKGQCHYNWSPYVYGFNSLDQYGTVRP